MKPESGAVSDQVRTLYDTVGWTMVDGETYDAQTSEDLRPVARDYVSRCRLRVLRHLPAQGDRLLDMASGPIQYPEYLRYSEHFRTRVCVDLSQRALDMAAARLGPRGEYLCGDFLTMAFADASVDAAVSLHTIYHINAADQASAVRKLLRVTKPGGVVVIVYSNPHYIVSVLGAPLRRLLRSIRPVSDASAERPDTLYFHRYPHSWWRQFGDQADVALFPWRTFATRDQKALITSSRIGAWLFALEEHFPSFFLRVGCYPMIVLRPRIEQLTPLTPKAPNHGGD
jgi:ubiquinone/menaquinone biosynthesis C-methylase UbiE